MTYIDAQNRDSLSNQRLIPVNAAAESSDVRHRSEKQEAIFHDKNIHCRTLFPTPTAFDGLPIIAQDRGSEELIWTLLTF